MKIKFKDQLEKIVKKQDKNTYKIDIYLFYMRGWEYYGTRSHGVPQEQSERDVKCISLKPTSCGRWWWWWAVGCKFTRFTDTDKTSQ